MAYVAPTAADLKAKFPALASVPDAAINLALTEAAVRVDETWTEGDFAPARMYLAAHILTLDGYGPGADVAGYRAAGVRSMKSGSLSAEFGSSAGQSADGASQYDLTPYGVRFAQLLRLNAGGPLVAGGTGSHPSHLAHDHPPEFGWQ